MDRIPFSHDDALVPDRLCFLRSSDDLPGPIRCFFYDWRASVDDKRKLTTQSGSSSAFAIVLLFLVRFRPEPQILGTASLAIPTVMIGTCLVDKIFRRRFGIS